MPTKIILAKNADDLNHIAAQVMTRKAQEAIAARGRFSIALSGGSSVRKAYELFAQAEGFDWSRVFFFWGDDRFVEPTNPYSNFRLSEEVLLKRLPQLPAGNVFPMFREGATPIEAARLYSETIRDFFSLSDGESPRFDLMQNGMGPDGHTASLFPGSPALAETTAIAVMNHAGLSPWVDRITLTLPVINQARCVLFLAAGGAKAEVLRRVLEEESDLSALPASAVRPLAGELIWVLEPEIAAKLRKTDFAPQPS